MSADRAAYERRQAGLLAALISGAGYPAGFPAEKADAASRALRSKRARAVEASWPALAHELGDEFPVRFDAYARRGDGPPARGGAIADGLAFAALAVARPVPDAIRVEIAFARAQLARRGFHLAALNLAEPRRLLVVLRLPRGEPRHRSIPLGRDR